MASLESFVILQNTRDEEVSYIYITNTIVSLHINILYKFLQKYLHPNFFSLIVKNILIFRSKTCNECYNFIADFELYKFINSRECNFKNGTLVEVKNDRKTIRRCRSLQY